MAEGSLDGILRDDEEAPAVKALEAIAGPESFAAAIADHALSQNPDVARQLASLAHKQAQSLVIRAEHFKYQHRPRLEYDCKKRHEAQSGLSTNSSSVRRRALYSSSRIANNQRRVCHDDT